MKRVLKIFGYGAWFIACLITFIYLTFPMGTVKGMVEDELEKVLGKGKQGRYGVDPVVSIGTLSPYMLSGATAKTVSIQLGNKEPEPGPTFVLDQVTARVGILSYLFSDPTVSFDIEAYNGDIAGSATVDLKPTSKSKSKRKLPPELRALDVEIEGVNLGRVPALIELAGAPVAGVLEGTVDLTLGENPAKDASGEVDLRVNNINIGPGEVLKGLPMMTGGLTVPLIEAGNLVIQAEADGGKLKTKQANVNGAHLKADFNAEVSLSKSLGRSKLKGDGWFQVTDAFFKAAPKFNGLLDLIPQLKRAKIEDGKYGVRLAGTLGSPRPTLGKTTKRARGRK